VNRRGEAFGDERGIARIEVGAEPISGARDRRRARDEDGDRQLDASHAGS
jgi:hypothetical protein